MFKHMTIILVLGWLHFIDGFLQFYPRGRPSYFSSEEVGDPLYVTPLLEAGEWKKAQDLSEVRLPDAPPSIVSYSGFITVNKDFNSNMFFWYFPAQFNPETSPLLIWLQGGPGGSSLFGLFTENGPFIVKQNGKVETRSTSWTLTHNVIYIDNPVGTGFSFTKNGYAENMTAVADDLFECLIQIYVLFPELRKRDLYITGESFAGKYVPAFSYKIHQENTQIMKRNNGKGINLKGLAIGDGLVDPASQTDYGEFLLSIGLIDSKQMDQMTAMENQVKEAIKKKDWLGAFNLFDALVSGDQHPSLFTNLTGYNYYFNFMETEEPKDFGYFVDYLEKPSTRRGIHVGNLSYSDEALTVEKHLMLDFMTSVKPWLEQLLDADYKVLIYNGQLDIIIANTLTTNMVHNLDWKGKEGFKKAERKQWKIKSELAGYSTSYENFNLVLVRGAGHMVPHDQPTRAFDLINRFTRGKPF